jgi:E3 ubiquitin-protein ligase BRE1
MGGDEKGEKERQINTLQRLVYCSLCSQRPKDCVIAKCFHAFCRKCINNNLTNRNRKCPLCQSAYDQKDVKNLYLFQ